MKVNKNSEEYLILEGVKVVQRLLFERNLNNHVILLGGEFEGVILILQKSTGQKTI
jgi:hypothetical protein